MGDVISDNLETWKKYLVVAGFNELQANALADTLRGFRKGLATQTDIRELRDTVAGTATKQDIIDLRKVISDMRLAISDMRQVVSDQQQAMVTKTDLAEAMQKMATKQDLTDLKEDMRGQRMTDRWMFTILWGLMVASNALLFHFMS